jgi:hypothetical protein
VGAGFKYASNHGTLSDPVFNPLPLVATCLEIEQVRIVPEEMEIK